METSINCLIQSKNTTHQLSIFGYSTRSIPGLEIKNLPLISRSLKQKILYLTKKLKITIPPRRYVISLDHYEISQIHNNKDLMWLELPILILYLSLARVIPISDLDDFYCSGTFKINGDITLYPKELFDQYFIKGQRQKVFHINQSEKYYLLNLEKILMEIQKSGDIRLKEFPSGL